MTLKLLNKGDLTLEAPPRIACGKKTTLVGSSNGRPMRNAPVQRISHLGGPAAGRWTVRVTGGNPLMKMSETQVEILVNGEARQVTASSTVADLIVALGLKSQHVAVERNREIVPRATHDQTTLAAGDQLEIVTFVGGG